MSLNEFLYRAILVCYGLALVYCGLVTLGVDRPALLFQDRRDDQEWSSCLSSLNQIASLDDNWDDAGAPAISGALIESARHVLSHLRKRGAPCPDRVVPSPSGSIVLEWQAQPGRPHIEAEIEEPYTIEWVYDYGDTVEFEKSRIEPPKRTRALESIARFPAGCLNGD